MATLQIYSNVQSYSVQIQSGLFSDLKEYLKPYTRLFVLTDRNVYSWYGSLLQEHLEKKAYHLEIIEPGESQKSWEQAQFLFEKMCAFQMDRQTPILAVGGGVISDLGGFCASLYLRGIPLLLCPTTLLAQVDACVGGKVAVNFLQTKNRLGQFYAPRHIFVDPTLIRTLPDRELRSGVGEMIKYGMIGPFSLLEKLSQISLEAFRTQNIEEWITLCLETKKRFVEADERDQGLRAILNFGHTLGHALESTQNFTLTHGEAVALGMYAVTRFAKDNGILKDVSVLSLLEKTLRHFDFPLQLTVSRQELEKFLVRDKKNQENVLCLILPTAQGEVCQNYRIAPSAFIDWIVQHFPEIQLR